MTLAIAVATMQPEGMVPFLIQGWMNRATEADSWFREPFKGPEPYVWYNTPSRNGGVVRSYEGLYQIMPTGIDVVCYFHDDCENFESGWDRRVLAEFEDPKVAIVGFGGAVRHGSGNLYKVPYRLQDLARFGYVSNVKDAEQHGERFTGSCDVAVLDGFALCIRRSFLAEIRGWSHLIENKIDYLNYDYWICALARRHGYRIRMVGISCAHYGGGTAVGVVPVDRTEEYEYAHRRFYEEFRAEMPASVRS